METCPRDGQKAVMKSEQKKKDQHGLKWRMAKNIQKPKAMLGLKLCCPTQMSGDLRKFPYTSFLMSSKP